MSTAAALLLLAVTVAAALLRPGGLPEVAVAVPAALLVLALGLLSPAEALDELEALGPTLAFLAAVLVLGELAERGGLFAALGDRIGRRARGRPVPLLALVFAAAALVTAFLSLDATVVLLTPVVYATAARSRLRARPHVYACVHLANSASLLLPVSNLSNLLAFHAADLSFARFAALMALPWLGVLAVEWGALRWRFASDLGGHGRAPDGPPARVPRLEAGVLAVTLAGLGLSSAAGVDPAVVAAAGAVVLAAAAERLGGDAALRSETGRAEDVVLAAAGDADVLVVARDGPDGDPPPHEPHPPPHERHPHPPHGPRRHGRGGPRSLGHATRFVVDHAPCAVLLVWPEP